MSFVKKAIIGICAGFVLSGCSKAPTVEDFKKHPELAKQITQECMQLAENKKNPFKNESCKALVYFEREQCRQNGNYFEAAQCENPLYLLSREAES